MGKTFPIFVISTHVIQFWDFKSQNYYLHTSLAFIGVYYNAWHKYTELKVWKCTNTVPSVLTEGETSICHVCKYHQDIQQAALEALKCLDLVDILLYFLCLAQNLKNTSSAIWKMSMYPCKSIGILSNKTESTETPSKSAKSNKRLRHNKHESFTRKRLSPFKLPWG